MLLRWLLSRAVFAPENDQGSAPDLDDEPDIDLDADPDNEEDPDPDLDDEPDLGLDDEPDDTGDPAPPEQRPSRGENRVSALARERKAERDRADALEREVAALRQQVQRPATPAETPEQRQARLSAMEPWERTEALRVEHQQQTDARIARMEFEGWDTRDRLSYDSLAAREPVAVKLKDDVEKALAQERAQGRNPSRESILKYLIGERALSGKNRASGRAQKTATANRERQQARPGSSRGDTGAEGGRRGGNDASAREKRLENLDI
jgi:hypothetical protein